MVHACLNPRVDLGVSSTLTGPERVLRMVEVAVCRSSMYMYWFTNNEAP